MSKALKMNWLNAKVDGSPNHNEEVIISVEGVYHVAVYNAKNKAYISAKNKKQSFKASEENIYWAKITPPGN
jgi:hypothetical protein